MIQFAAQIDNVSRKKDRTLSIKLGTQELPSDDTSHIFDYADELVWIGVKKTPHTEDLSVPEEILDFRTEKSPSQRLRSSLYRLWEQDKKTETFEEYYRIIMEKFINHVKDKLT